MLPWQLQIVLKKKKRYESLSKELKNLKRSQMEIIEMKKKKDNDQKKFTRWAP